MNESLRRVSTLSSVEKVTARNKTVPRRNKISRISPHCVAGNLSVEAILSLPAFHDGVSASAGYAIGSDGRMGLGVEETNRPWTTSSSTNDHRAITFEIANTGGAPDWRMSDAAINKFLDATVEICKFYGYSKVNYQQKPLNVVGLTQVENWISTWAKDDEMIITLHNWYANKECPGPYLMRQLPWLIREMNKRLQDNTWVPEAFVGEGEIEDVSVRFAPYTVRVNVAALNVRGGPGTNNPVVKTLYNDKNVYTIVDEAVGTGSSKWGKLKSGIGWISLDYITKTK